MERTLWWLGLALVAVCLVALPPTVSARELAPEPGELLFFEDFDTGFDGPDQRVARGWQPWSLPHLCSVEGSGMACQTPEYKQSSPAGAYPDRVRGEGGNAQQWFTVWSGHFAGIARRITVPAHARLEVGAWASAWSSSDDDPHATSSATRVRIGIDPAGGTEPGAASVVWGEPLDPPNAVFVEVPVLVGEDDGSGEVTIYIASDPQFAVKHNNIYIDDVYVRYLGSAAPALPTAPGDGVYGGAVSALVVAQAPDPVLEGLVAEPLPAQAGASSWSIAVLGSLLLGTVMWLTWERKRA